MISGLMRRLWPNPRVLLALIVVLPWIFFGAFPSCAQSLPPVKAVVDIPTQTMKVYVGGHLRYAWTVSTADPNATGCTIDGTADGEPTRCKTPIGTFHPTRIAQRAFSQKWKSWLYWPVFIDSTGDAIHGTDEVDDLGKPASHGCARLKPEDAQTFYNLVLDHRRGDSFPGVTIVIKDVPRYRNHGPSMFI